MAFRARHSLPRQPLFTTTRDSRAGNVVRSSRSSTGLQAGSTKVTPPSSGAPPAATARLASTTPAPAASIARQATGGPRTNHPSNTTCKPGRHGADPRGHCETQHHAPLVLLRRRLRHCHHPLWQALVSAAVPGLWHLHAHGSTQGTCRVIAHAIIG